MAQLFESIPKVDLMSTVWLPLPSEHTQSVVTVERFARNWSNLALLQNRNGFYLTIHKTQPSGFRLYTQSQPQNHWMIQLFETGSKVGNRVGLAGLTKNCTNEELLSSNESLTISFQNPSLRYVPKRWIAYLGVCKRVQLMWHMPHTSLWGPTLH